MDDELGIGEQARELAVRCLYELDDDLTEGRISATAAAETIARQAAPRRRLEPLLRAAVALAAVTSFYANAGWPSFDGIEEALGGDTDALAGESRKQLRVQLHDLAAEMSPLAERFERRRELPPSAWEPDRVPGYTWRLREAAIETAAIAALLMVRSRRGAARAD